MIFSVESLLEYFEKLGVVLKVDYNQQKGKGKIEFQTAEMVKSLLYKCLKIGEIEIFTWQSLEFFEERAEPGLIVVGSISMNCVYVF